MTRLDLRPLLTLLVLAAPALAQKTGALQISCGDCGAFQAIQVYLDGQSMATGNPVNLTDIAAGVHEVRVVKWKNPFKTEEVHTQRITVLANKELRIKATPGKLDVYGTSAWAPPPPPPEPAGPPVAADDGPQGDTRRAQDLLDDARDALKDLQDRVDDADDECSGKLLGRLGALEDALKDASRSLSRRDVKDALRSAGDAQRVVQGRCANRDARKWGKTLDRIIERLQKADREL